MPPPVRHAVLMLCRTATAKSSKTNSLTHTTRPTPTSRAWRGWRTISSGVSAAAVHACAAETRLGGQPAGRQPAGRQPAGRRAGMQAAGVHRAAGDILSTRLFLINCQLLHPPCRQEPEGSQEGRKSGCPVDGKLLAKPAPACSASSAAFASAAAGQDGSCPAQGHGSPHPCTEPFS